MPGAGNSVGLAGIGLAMTILYIVCPFEILINKWANKGIAKQASVRYENVVHTFATDYDMENPVTAHSGDHEGQQTISRVDEVKNYFVKM
jgi:hypothetical protein